MLSIYLSSCLINFDECLSDYSRVCNEHISTTKREIFSSECCLVNFLSDLQENCGDSLKDYVNTNYFNANNILNSGNISQCYSNYHKNYVLTYSDIMYILWHLSDINGEICIKILSEYLNSSIPMYSSPSSNYGYDVFTYVILSLIGFLFVCVFIYIIYFFIVKYI